MRSLFFISTLKTILVSLHCMCSAMVYAGTVIQLPQELPVEQMNNSSKQSMPSPELLPEQVVAIQLKAMQNNDEKDTGIATTFNFAAPENKKVTGPLNRFIQLVKNQVYAPLLNFKKCEVNKMHIEGDEAQQIVIVVDKNGKKAAFLFSLSKQAGGPYKGCWMTDSVIRLAYEEKVARA